MIYLIITVSIIISVFQSNIFIFSAALSLTCWSKFDLGDFQIFKGLRSIICVSRSQLSVVYYYQHQGGKH